MKKQLETLFFDYLEQATDEQLSVLNDILAALQKKQQKPSSIYINEILQMERKTYENSAEVTIPITPLLQNIFGMVHGGITATIMDSAMGTFVNDILPEGYGAVTTSLNIHFLAAGKGDYIKCVAEMEHKGSKTMVLSADVFRSDGKKIATATGSFFVVKKKG